MTQQRGETREEFLKRMAQTLDCSYAAAEKALNNLIAKGLVRELPV